jgi:hypothetical protein
MIPVVIPQSKIYPLSVRLALLRCIRIDKSTQHLHIMITNTFMTSFDQIAFRASCIKTFICSSIGDYLLSNFSDDSSVMDRCIIYLDNERK